MTSPNQQTTGVDLDAVAPHVQTEQSQAPTGAAAGGPMPTVGTNAKSEWNTWDPNLWWTDWTLPQDPRPSWERWFDWVNQLSALTPALGEASQDWQTLIGQFDEQLTAVRGMRADLATWNGPSAQTMSDSLDRLENSITTKMSALQENPAKLQQLSQAISDAVPPMQALDAEYQQVLQDLNACRQVAERGQPIMLNLATQLLQVGTDLENSVQADNLAPQPVPPQALALSSGPQGPTNQLAQVAGTGNLTDPGAVTPGNQIATTDLPQVAGTGNLTDPGFVQTGQQVGVEHVPGVAVGAGGDTSGAAAAAMPADTGASATAAPTLAGVSAGGAAPTLPAGPVAAPTAGVSAPMSMVSPTMAPATMASGFMPATPLSGAPKVAPPDSVDRKEAHPTGVVGVPVMPAAAAAGGALNGSAAVPASLRGRAAEQSQPVPTIEGIRRDAVRPLDSEAFEVGDAGSGTVTAPK
jgi:hypothetical protein